MGPRPLAVERIPRGAILAVVVAALALAGCRSDFTRVAPTVSHPAVVTLHAVRGPSRRVIGTGFFVGERALVTARHVARAGAFDVLGSGPPPVVEATFSDGTTLPVVGVLGASPDHDVVVMTVDRPAFDAATIPIGDEPLSVGDRVASVGSPGGRAQTVGVGRVVTSALTGEPSWEDLFEVSIGNSGGASGCPIFDARGRAAGVAVRGSPGPDGSTIAVPIRFAVPLLSGTETSWEAWRTASLLSPPERAAKQFDQASIAASMADRPSTARAAELYGRAAALSNRCPELEECVDGVCDALCHLDRRDEALDLLHRNARRRPRCGWAERLLAVYLDKTGDAKEAAAHFAKACALDPKDARCALHAGESAWRHGRFPEALPSLRRAVALAPGWAYAWEILGAAASSVRWFAEAEPAYRRLVTLRPDYAPGFAAYARVLLMSGQVLEAGDAALAAVRLDAKSLTAHEVLVSVHYAAKDDAGVAKEIESVRAIDPARGKTLDDWRKSLPPR